jgi:tetratricopeptide (TPR) repeat protein
MRLIYLFLGIVLCFSTDNMFCQGTTDDQLADYYYQNGDFEKAIIYYQKVYSNNPNQNYYLNYLQSLIKTSNYKDAEKLVKRNSKLINPINSYVDLGMVYKAAGETDKANQQFQKAIKELDANQSMVINLASNFIRINELNFALETYLKGQKLLRNEYPFNYEIATLYGQMGETGKMIDSYLELIEFNETYLQTVQNSLNRNIEIVEENPKSTLLKESLLKRVQKDPDKIIFSEMLIWYFIQKKDFSSALIQTKSLDKRLNEDGNRLIGLAQVCLSNDDYANASKCYEYIIQKGKNSKYYAESRMDMLDVEFQKITNNYAYSVEEIEALNKSYQSTIEEFGENAGTSKILKDYAHFIAFYMHDLEQATDVLNRTIDLPGINNNFKADCKIDLADILVAKNYIWDASLLYSQVEADFKQDVLGSEAKFKNSRISYFTGDFEWAQAQLNVLKASTTKLISNDAMDLSLLITDNLGFDSIFEPLQMFATADLLIFQNRLAEASVTLDSIKIKFPGHALGDEILFQEAIICEKRGEFENAAKIYLDLFTGFSEDILADNALFKLGEIFERRIVDKEKAMKYYEQLITDFPGSLFVVEARKRFRNLRGDSNGINNLPIIEKKENP